MVSETTFHAETPAFDSSIAISMSQIRRRLVMCAGVVVGAYARMLSRS